MLLLVFTVCSISIEHHRAVMFTTKNNLNKNCFGVGLFSNNNQNSNDISNITLSDKYEIIFSDHLPLLFFNFVSMPFHICENYFIKTK